MAASEATPRHARSRGVDPAAGREAGSRRGGVERRRRSAGRAARAPRALSRWAARGAARPRSPRTHGRAPRSRRGPPTGRRRPDREREPLPVSGCTSSANCSPITGIRSSAVVDDVVAQRRVVIEHEPEHRDEREQQREQREERVVGDQRGEARRTVLAELLHARRPGTRPARAGAASRRTKRPGLSAPSPHPSPPPRTMQRKPICAVEVSIVSPCRAAGRKRRQ